MSQPRIQILEGVYKIRGQDTSVAGTVFELVQHYREGSDGQGYVTVNGASAEGFPERTIRIRCQSADSYQIVEGSPEPAMLSALRREPEGVVSFVQDSVPDTVVAHESDDEIKARLRGRFEVLKNMTQAVKEGNVRAMIVTGPPGVGKSFGVEEVLSKDDLFDTLGQRKPRYEVIKGAMSAVGLYSQLYKYSEKGNVIVFDDCDSILLDDLSLNILKAALDSSKKRTISWNTDSRVLRNEGVPDKFEFKAGAIFITNIKFEHVRSKKLRDHLEALESRCHYLDLTMDTEREKMLRIRQIVEDGMLDSYEFTPEVRDEVVEFITDNRQRMRELSLRMVLKVSDLRKSFPDNWQSMAQVTCMKGSQ